MNEKPKRQLTLLDLTCVGINAVVGSSIFLFPGRLAGHLGPASIIAFGLTGLLLICVGLCFAEASTYFDRAGGPYLYAGRAFGDSVGFGIGWMCWVTQIFSWAAVANAIAVYLSYFGSQFASAWWVKGVAVGVILTMGALNYRGVKLGALTSDFFTAAKLIPLGLFVILGLPQIHLANYVPFAPHGWAPMGSACFLAYFAFQGFETIPVPSGEADRPERNVPLAVIGALLLSAILYMLVQAVAVGVNPGLAGSTRPLADAAAIIMGPIGAALIVAGAVISTTGYNAGTALTAPRYLVAMSEDSHLPKTFFALHPKFGTPYQAVAITTGLTLAAAMVFDFNKLVDFSNVVVCAQYVATCAAIPFLRKSGARPVGKFKMPGGWIVPIIGIAATLWLGSQGGVAQIWWSIAILAFGFVLRAAFVKFCHKI
ncbi:MAG: amino acid permease [Elusimicrobia bacterium]|nr:amino acid permease [Elusimicrobiota bacterium]